MIRLLLLIVALLAVPAVAPAQAPAGSPVASVGTKPASAISAEQARIALDVLNDPKKRAAFAATLDAIV